MVVGSKAELLPSSEQRKDELDSRKQQAGLITVHGANGIGVYICIIMASCSLSVRFMQVVKVFGSEILSGSNWEIVLVTTKVD